MNKDTWDRIILGMEWTAGAVVGTGIARKDEVITIVGVALTLLAIGITAWRNTK